MNTAAAQGMRTVTALTRSAAVRPEVGSEDRSEHAVELCHVTARPTSVEDALERRAEVGGWHHVGRLAWWYIILKVWCVYITHCAWCMRNVRPSNGRRVVRRVSYGGGRGGERPTRASTDIGHARGRVASTSGGKGGSVDDVETVSRSSRPGRPHERAPRAQGPEARASIVWCMV